MDAIFHELAHPSRKCCIALQNKQPVSRTKYDLPSTIKTLEASGYCLKRHGANHDIYYNPDTHSTIPVKRPDFNENDMKYILKEANIIGKH